MQFFKSLSIAAVIALVSANSVDMVSQDNVDRTIVFVAQSDNQPIPEMQLKGGETKTVTFPEGWIGNFYALRPEDPKVDGMLGELRFNGDGDKTFFDVSAIVNPNDHHNVKILRPKQSGSPESGCQTFPCANAYNLPDDVQTKVTTEKELVCLIGDTAASKARRHARVFRD
jgi:hypothetical protein